MTQSQGCLWVVLIELERRIQTAHDAVRRLPLQRDRESLLRERDVALIPSQLSAQCEQTCVVWRQTQPATQNLTQLVAVLCDGDPNVDDLHDVRDAETVVRRNEFGVDRDDLLEVAHCLRVCSLTKHLLAAQIQ